MLKNIVDIPDQRIECLLRARLLFFPAAVIMVFERTPHENALHGYAGPVFTFDLGAATLRFR
ncbi:MAG: hypothetical protein R3E50_00195 [Halioglobus sp.]